MKTRPILFSDQMVRTLLNGRKTQTRRIVKPQPSGVAIFRFAETFAIGATTVCQINQAMERGCPYGDPGDRLWVREAWATLPGWDGIRPNELPIYLRGETPACEIVFRTDSSDSRVKRWRPSIFMPRHASRITLEIVCVRVERLQQISPLDSIAEGTDLDVDYNLVGDRFGQIPYPVKAYALLWESLNGPGSWALNPFVWVVEFRRI